MESKVSGALFVYIMHCACSVPSAAGRQEFAGYRNLIGCYVGIDDFESKFRVLNKRVAQSGLGVFGGL